MAIADESKPPHTTTNYILAALGGTLATTAVLTIVSVVLSPAHITFTVTRAWRTSRPGDDGAEYLNLTISVANGSQRRAAVRYQSVFVDLKNSTSADGKDTIDAQVDARPPVDDYLRGTAPANISASALLVAGEWAKGFASRRVNVSGFTVVVTAQVRFKIGVARTRLYDVKVSCPRVLFPEERSSAKSNTTAPPHFSCSG